MQLHALVDPRLLTLDPRHLLLALRLTFKARLLLLLTLDPHLLALDARLMLLTLDTHLLALVARLLLLLLTLDSHLLALEARLLLLTFNAHLRALNALLLLRRLLLPFHAHLLAFDALLLLLRRLPLPFGAHLLTIAARRLLLLLLGRGLLSMVAAALPAAAAMLPMSGHRRSGNRQRRDRRDQKGLGHGKFLTVHEVTGDLREIRLLAT